MKSSEIRKAFLDYFASKGHQIVNSSPLIPGNDATLLFTNAGMVQFKDTFLGLEPRSYNRATTSQKCLRAGGKHNDLENVGYTARHHTFFEMLGNFSFGDYFKREAIRYAWDFLTTILKLPAERLWITVYKDDDETADIWLKEMGISAERFSRCGEKDNFWSMGDTGPCGPCTEIFYDHGPSVAGGPPGSADEDGDRYIEIWNLVFMQFNRDKDGTLHPLPKPSVDTGMGLERIAAVVQHVHANYEIDIFQHVIKAIQALGENLDKENASLKVIADHIRACSFLICDGVIPSNEGRGYVLRRIIRRAIRHGNKLKLPTPFFSLLVSPLIEVMGDAYPELIENKAQIEAVLNQEENQFAKTLEQGLRLLKTEIGQLKNKEIPGDVAFKLYDTYGFPIDLTADIARELGLSVDMQVFEEAMQKQRQSSQAAHQFEVDYSFAANLNQVSEFHGYERTDLNSKILTLLCDNKEVSSLASGAKGAIILEKTPFYAESGGQVGDKGEIATSTALFRVDDCQRIGQAIVHYGEVLQGVFNLNDEVRAAIDNHRREAIRLNHTATHLLHAALKKVVGAHVQQKGSLVDAERARFDFSHFEGLTATQLEQIEVLVNEQIRANNAAYTEVMGIEAAKEKGAVALFGEKYSDSVRVLSIGDFSMELCGGTHAKKTGDIGLFKIVAEYGVAAGVRRIEMMTGAYALAWVNEQLKMIDEMALKLKTTPAQANEKLSQFLADAKQKEKELQKLNEKLAAHSGGELMSAVKKIHDINLLVEKLPAVDGQTLRATMDNLKSKLENAVIVLIAIDNDKMNVIASVSKNLLGQLPKATEFVKELCGKGGGRDDMAQGGGALPSDLEQRIKRIEDMIVI